MMGLISITHLMSASVPNNINKINNINNNNSNKTVYIKDSDFSSLSVTPPEMSSLPFTPTTLEEEEEEDSSIGRPGSSLSTSSRASSRIPVRSASLRIKGVLEARSGVNHGVNRLPGAKPGKGIVRSASFNSSRGLPGLASSFSTSNLLTSNLHHHHHHHHHLNNPSSTTTTRKALTPETPRRVTPRRPIITDRKTQSYAGLGNSWHPSLSYNRHHSNSNPSNQHGVPSNHHPSNQHGVPSNHHPSNQHGVPSNQHPSNHTKRPNFLPVTNHTTSVPSTPGSQPATPCKTPDLDNDNDSVKSLGSISSTVSCDAALHSNHSNHSNQKDNHGIHSNHYSNHHSNHQDSKGRNLKYVLHCRHSHDQEDPDKYLTPTQRAARRIRELKSQLAEARREVHTRDAEITRLTRELVELRLLKARTTHHWEDDNQGSTDGSTHGSQHLIHPTRPDSDRLVAASESHHPHTRTTTPTQKTPSATPSEGSEPELSRLMDSLVLTNGVCESGTTRVRLASPAARSASETTGDSVELARSLADSGHYDDLTSPALSARDPFEGSSLRGQPIEEDREAWTKTERETEASGLVARLKEEVRRLQEELRRREEALRRNHLEDYNDLKEKHNDRVESLLAKLSDANLKYFEIRPQYTRSQERVRELEGEVVALKEELGEAEMKHQKMYLQMFLKGQQAARLQADDEMKAESAVDVGDGMAGGAVIGLMRQLSHTQEELEKVKALYHRELSSRNNNNTTNKRDLDPEVTLQFLKSAIYYFLTDKDNARGHLRAIESILGYTDRERLNMNRGGK